jgi:hypothetical protein
MGSLASLSTPVDSRWPTGWQLSVDPVTRAFLDVLRRLNPGAYNEAQAEAEQQVEQLIGGAVPRDPSQTANYDELAERLGLDSSQSDVGSVGESGEELSVEGESG